MTQTFFGTDGIRAVTGTYPLTLEALPQLGMVIGKWMHGVYQHPPVILLGHDTRASCSLIKTALQAGLIMQGASIYDADVIPTPGVGKIIKQNSRFNLGIIISASHNPYTDNGIKLVDAQNGKLTFEDESTISHLFYQNKFPANYSALGSTVYWPDAFDYYVSEFKKYFSNGFLSKRKIVLDCAHGATYRIAPLIFQYYGAQVITINDVPTGTNINDQCGALYPAALQRKVVEHGADIGFAFDGDGDRVIAVNRKGEIKDGDDILTVLLNHPLYATEKNIVGTTMTNQGLAAYLSEQGKRLLRACVGDKFVAEQMEKELSIIGGEQSGHIILRDYLTMGDGIFTALRTLEALDITNNWDMHTFQRFPQLLINIEVAEKKDLHHPVLATIIADHQAQLSSGRLVVRYSGTEPLLRILVEDRDATTAQRVGAHLSDALVKNISLV